MYENMSADVTGPRSNDLTARRLDQLVVASDFVVDTDYSKQFKEEHEMIKEVEVARRVAYRELTVRLQFCQFPEACNKQDQEAIAVDTNQDLKAQLDECETLNVMKIMGAIVNPLFQKKKRMVAAGLCTDEQYEAGKAELLRRITRAYDRIDGSEDAVHVATTAEARNEWSSSEDEEGDVVAVVTQSSKKAETELDLYLSYMKSMYQPQMEATKALGAYDDDGNPRDPPIYAIEKVTKKGLDLPSRFNLADYVDRKGHFDLVSYVMDHSIPTSIKKKPPFVGIGNVIIGQLAPHITTEVDCESLFSQAGHLSQPNRNRTTAETFERMVMAKHRLA
ncbi:hypothetical protein ACHAXR_003875, partial [Thalassiosira sp. AJA248-18]